MCALPQLEAAGITHLKLVGRGNYVEDMIRDIRNLKAALGALEENRREEKETGRYIDQLNKKIFDGQPCGKNCIYNPGQFLLSCMGKKRKVWNRKRKRISWSRLLYEIFMNPLENQGIPDV